MIITIYDQQRVIITMALPAASAGRALYRTAFADRSGSLHVATMIPLRHRTPRLPRRTRTGSDLPCPLNGPLPGRHDSAGSASSPRVGGGPRCASHRSHSGPGRAAGRRLSATACRTLSTAAHDRSHRNKPVYGPVNRGSLAIHHYHYQTDGAYDLGLRPRHRKLIFRSCCP